MFPSGRHLVIGYWHDTDEEGTIPFPHPHALVDPAWEPSRRADIVRYLKMAAPTGSLAAFRIVGWDAPRSGYSEPLLRAPKPSSTSTVGIKPRR
jgi:hypothetical protein